MRYSGHLMSDVPDNDLTLSRACTTEITRDFHKRDYPKDSISKAHSFVTALVLENEGLKKRLSVDKPGCGQTAAV